MYAVNSIQQSHSRHFCNVIKPQNMDKVIQIRPEIMSTRAYDWFRKTLSIDREYTGQHLHLGKLVFLT